MNYIALKMLMGDTSKYIGIIVGIVFSALIMTQQPSIFIGLMSRTFGFITDVGYPDLWVMDPKVQFIDDIKPLQDTQLLRIRGVEGIKWAVPLYKGILRARTADGNFQNCIVVGLDDATLIGAPGKMLQGSISDLRNNDSIIVDLDGANQYLRFKEANGNTRPLQVGDTLEINDRRATVVGLAQTTRTFQSQPIIYTTYTRAMAFAPQERLKLSFILAGIKEGYTSASVIKNIQDHTTLTAYTGEQFKHVTVNYFMKKTGIPINFGISVLLGFLVGAAIAGQMFYNFTHENIKQFGTLKAIGASNAMLIRMILLQALFVGATGWGIGIGLASLFGYAIKHSVLAFKMPWEVLALSASGVLIIVSFAALISIRKVVTLEPAIVFRN
jgi:putative ABC transport system permease protein